MNLDLDRERHMKPKVMHLHQRIMSQWNVTTEGKEVCDTEDWMANLDRMKGSSNPVSRAGKRKLQSEIDNLQVTGYNSFRIKN